MNWEVCEEQFVEEKGNRYAQLKTGKRNEKSNKRKRKVCFEKNLFFCGSL